MSPDLLGAGSENVLVQILQQQARLMESLSRGAPVLDTGAGGSSSSAAGTSNPWKIRSTTPEFSKIAGPEQPEGGERLFDWLWLLSTEISDICDKAKEWWDRVVASASEAYNRNSKAQTMDRIDVKAVPVIEPEAQMLASRVKVNIL